MKRGGPLKRKSEMKRSRLRRRGARLDREAEGLVRFIETVSDRCRIPGEVGYYRCERCKSRVPGLRFECHHITPRSRAASDLKHDPVRNGAGLCSTCHRSVHDHTVPDWREWVR